jgi:exonuclease SbcC
MTPLAQELMLLRAQESGAIEAAARARQDLTALEALATEQRAAREEAARLRARHTTLAALCDAYRQIPIMILDTIARPILEAEANTFLATTARNRMQVRIETQREIKSRDTLADGLEIYVRDWRGERSLDEYSGGQKFELYLAFRIAWTRLQERRSGAGIDTLFVDEGFGSLSEGDLESVIAALREVQHEFAFLGVISHVPRMRDIFPCRVQVTGGHEDSHAELVTP